MTRLIWVAAAAGGLVAGTTSAQPARVITAPAGALTYRAENPNAARIGVYVTSGDLRDTLGVLVSSVVEGGPAASAGLRAGDRIVAIDGVNLRMSRLDAEDPMLRGMMSRRLTRTLDAKTAGDEVELRVWSDGQTRTLRVKTVAARELARMGERALAATIRTRSAGGDRAALGMSLGATPSKRDTLGVLIVGVTPDGPAEKAGLVEGDRIARIGDVDLRVPSEDAGDAMLAHARVNRLIREIEKLKPGDTVTLSVWSGGRQREVRVTSVRASELRGADVQMFFRDGSLRFITRPPLPRLDAIEPSHSRVRAAMTRMVTL